jgi:hypothetical protein
MDKSFREFIGLFLFIYIDDLIIFSKTFEEHLEHIRKILTRAREKNIYFKLSKCSLACNSVKYLGHIVSEKGIKVDPEKVEALNNIKKLKNKDELDKFWGLASYYRKFLGNDLNTVAESLLKLKRKNVEYNWDENCQKALEEIKRRLSSSPVLTYPNFKKKFFLATDASNIGIGAILFQKYKGKEKVIAYFSKSLRGAELNYPVMEKEALAWSGLLSISGPTSMGINLLSSLIISL